MKIYIIGSGYVGLVTGACLSDFGLEVICVDKDENKIKILNSGSIPIYEPNLENLIKKNIKESRLTFTKDIKSAVEQSKVISILATKITFINEIENLCEKVGADVHQIAKAIDNARKIIHNITYCQDENKTAQGSNILVIAAEWNQFRNLDFIKIKKLLKATILIDLRNLYEPKRVKELGFIYKGVGRW